MIKSQDKRKPERFNISLCPDTAEWLKSYAAELDSDLQYVIREIIEEYRLNLTREHSVIARYGDAA